MPVSMTFLQKGVERITRNIKSGVQNFDNVVRANNPFIRQMPPRGSVYATSSFNERGSSVPISFEKAGYLMASSINPGLGSSPVPQGNKFYSKEYSSAWSLKGNFIEVVNLSKITDKCNSGDHGDAEGKVAEILGKFVLNSLSIKGKLSPQLQADFAGEINRSLHSNDQMQIISTINEADGSSKVAGFTTANIIPAIHMGKTAKIVDLSPPLYLPFLMIDKSVVNSKEGSILLKMMLLEHAVYGYYQGAEDIVAISRDLRLIDSLAKIADPHDPAIGGQSEFAEYPDLEKQLLEDAMGVEFVPQEWLAKNIYLEHALKYIFYRSPLFIPTRFREVPISHYEQILEKLYRPYVFYGKFNPKKALAIIDDFSKINGLSSETRNLISEIKRQTGNL